MVDEPSNQEPSELKANDKPFDDDPFDAGVEADEDQDPKKFIEQLAGKIGTELRKYNDEVGEPDFDLEKYVINSVVSATHTGDMDNEDKNDIIKKINTAGGKKDEDTKMDDDNSSDDSSPEDSNDSSSDDFNPDFDEKKDDLDESDIYYGNDPKFNTAEGNVWENEDVFEINELLSEESPNPTRYMFFSNLEQIRRQADLLLKLDEGQIEAILNSGHDWAADHIATAKESLDQVFDFLMNETKSDDGWNSNDDEEEDDYSEWSKPMELKKDIQISEELKYHLDNKLALGESIFRYGSDKFINLLKEVKSLYNQELINLNENDVFIVNDLDTKVKINGNLIQLGQIMESEEGTDIINEAEYKGKEVELGKPKRGGSKKFYVYVKNPKTGKVKKVSFGAKAGGGNLAVKLKDPKARKAFADRHNCEQKNDKTTPGYWSCRLPRYSKLLGLSGGGRFW